MLGKNATSKPFYIVQEKKKEKGRKEKREGGRKEEKVKSVKQIHLITRHLHRGTA